MCYDTHIIIFNFTKTKHCSHNIYKYTNANLKLSNNIHLTIDLLNLSIYLGQFFIAMKVLLLCLSCCLLTVRGRKLSVECDLDDGGCLTSYIDNNGSTTSFCLNTNFSTYTMSNNERKLEDISGWLAVLSENVSCIHHALHQQEKIIEEIQSDLSNCSFQDKPTSTVLQVPQSCSEVKKKEPNSPSGVYLITSFPKGDVKYIYCHMEKLCGIDGPWTRVAYLNMSRTDESCPYGFKLYNKNSNRGCGRPLSERDSCKSMIIPTNSMNFSRVCGRVHGLNINSPEGFYRKYHNHINNIDAPYVDGISLTYGHPRQHIWTFAAGGQHSECYCPCHTNAKTPSPHIVGNDYYCETGIGSTEQLWDGDCLADEQNTCCNNTHLPWFFKPLKTPIADFLELRVCSDESTTNENILLRYYEIYVQ